MIKKTIYKYLKTRILNEFNDLKKYLLEKKQFVIINAHQNHLYFILWHLARNNIINIYNYV